MLKLFLTPPSEMAKTDGTENLFRRGIRCEIGAAVAIELNKTLCMLKIRALVSRVALGMLVARMVEMAGVLSLHTVVGGAAVCTVVFGMIERHLYYLRLFLKVTIALLSGKTLSVDTVLQVGFNEIISRFVLNF